MSETKVIRTTDELLSLRDSAGIIKHDGHMHIECDVPYWESMKISGLYVVGELTVRDDLTVLDNLTVLGNLYARGDLTVHGDIDKIEA